MLEIALETHERGTILPVRARAGASHNAIAGVHDGLLRVTVTTAPEKGKANQAIVAVLAKALGVPKSSLELVSGATSPRKRFLVVGVERKSLQEALSRYTNEARY
jgi:hypothetical protein